jgi:membrane-bound serine protease (ClpP class)
MLLLGGILLAVFVVPWPWGIATVIGGGLLDVAESFAFLKWSRRRTSSVGAEALVGQTAVVETPTQVRVAGELWTARTDSPLRVGDEVVVREVDGLTLVVTPQSPAPR